MNKLFLSILSCKVVFLPIASLFFFNHPAMAREIIFQAPQPSSSCVQSSPQTKLVCVKQQAENTNNNNLNSPSEDLTPMLEFTDEESDSAIAMFGCDCFVCINALRQLRGMSSIPGTT